MGKGVADAARLFAVATPAEAAPFLERLGRLLDDDAYYADASARAYRAARAHAARPEFPRGFVPGT